MIYYQIYLFTVAFVSAPIAPASAFQTILGNTFIGGRNSYAQLINNQISFIPLHASVVEPKTEGRQALSPAYAKAKEQLMAAIRESAPQGFPMEKWDGFIEHFVTEYGQTIQESGKYSPEFFVSNMLPIFQLGFKYGLPTSPDHYTFETAHTAIREPFDYYEWGCNFFRPAMDLDNSVVIGEENLKRAFEQVKAGDNVVFLANHQSEADPQVMSCLLESIGLGKEAAELTYVAGHKVRTDVLAVPFSMGRNILCIHSKKHIDADPETKADKTAENLKTMGAMQQMMKQGGLSIWVAPSGGRDRRNVATGEIPIAPFDQKTIDMFRLMANKSKTPTHFYPLAMVSYYLCPPPDTVEASTGEARNVRFEPVGIACGNVLESVGGLESRHLFTQHAQQVVEENYQILLDAINQRKNT